jgi:hypothetical protein
MKKLIAIFFAVSVALGILMTVIHPAAPAPATPTHVITDVCEPGGLAIQQACSERGLATPQCAELEMSVHQHTKHGKFSCSK